MYLPQIHLLKPNPQSDGVRIEGGVKRQCLGYEGGAIMNGISVSIKSPKNSLALVTIARSQQSAIRKRAFARIQPCWHYDSGLPAFTTVRREFRLFISHPFVRTAWLDQDNKSSPFQLQTPARPTSAKTRMPEPRPGDPPAQAPAPGWWAAWAAVAESADAAGTFKGPWKPVKMLESGNLLAPRVPRD